jgi:hypothetical protein
MSVALAPVVIQPHAGHWLEAHGSSKQGANKGDKVAEDRDGAGNDVGNQTDAEST